MLLRSQTLLSSARAINFEPSNPDSAAEELSVDVELSIVIILACLIFPLIVLFKPFGFVITCLSFIKMRLQRSCFHSEVDIDQYSGMMSSRAEQTVVESPQIIPISFNAAQKPESKPSMPPDPYNPADWIVMPDVNKLGKVSNRTSWDSFSYAIQMGHNVWSHINAVQEANRQYDAGIIPSMLVQEKFSRIYFKDVVDSIFAANDKGSALAIVEDYRRYFDTIIGTRGNTGKKMTNASANFTNLFDIVEQDPVQLEHAEEFTEAEESKLDELEEAVKNDAT